MASAFPFFSSASSGEKPGATPFFSARTIVVPPFLSTLPSDVTSL